MFSFNYHDIDDLCSYAATNWTAKDHFMIIRSRAAHWQIICVLFLKGATYNTSKVRFSEKWEFVGKTFQFLLIAIVIKKQIS